MKPSATFKHYYLAILIFILPFLPMLSPATATIIGNYYLRDSITVLIAFFVIVFFNLSKTQCQIHISLSQLLVGLFILLIMIAQLYNTGFYKSYCLEAISILFVGLLLSIAINAYKDKETLATNQIAYAIIICCYIQILISICQLSNVSLTLSTTLYSFDLTQSAIINFNILSGSGERITGGLNQTNNLADLLAWGLFANISIWTNSNKRLQVFFCITTLILLNFFISLTYSRIAVVFAVFMIIYGLLVWFKNKSSSKLLLTHGIALLSCIFMASKGYFNFAYDKYGQTNTTATKQIIKKDNGQLQNSSRMANSFALINDTLHGQKINLAASDSQRITLWKRGLYEFMEHPLLGVGWAQFSSNLFNKNVIKNTTALPQLSLPINAHNLFIQLLATTGIIGFFIVISFLVFGLYQAWKQPIPKQVLFFGVIMTILLHSQVEYPLFYVPFLYCLLTLITLVDNTNMITLNHKQVKAFRFILPIICIMGLWQILVGIDNFLILSQLKKPANYIKNNPVNNIIMKYKISMNPLWTYYVDADIAQKINFSQITSQNYHLFNVTYNATKNIEEFTPYPNYTIKLAFLEALQGNYQQTKSLIEKVLNNYPEFISTITEWVMELSVENPQIRQQMLDDINTWSTSYTKKLRG